MKPNSEYVTFVVTGFDCDPDEITKQLGLSPTYAGLQGESVRRGDKSLLLQRNIWVLQHTSSATDTGMEKHLDSFLELLQGHEKQVRAISDRYETQLSLVGYYYNTNNPGFLISRQNLQRITKLGMDIDIDLYALA